MVITVIVERDSIHAADEPGEAVHAYPADVELRGLVAGIGYLPTGYTWAVYQLTEAGRRPLAVVNEPDKARLFFPDPATPLSRLADGKAEIRVYCQSCAHQEPHEAFSVISDGGKPGFVYGKLYSRMGTLYWAATDGGQRAGALGQRVAAMFAGGERARAEFCQYFRRGVVLPPVYPDRPERQEALDAAVHDLNSWARDGRIELFALAYHAARILREDAGLYQVALRLEELADAALREPDRDGQLHLFVGTLRVPTDRLDRLKRKELRHLLKRIAELTA